MLKLSLQLSIIILCFCTQIQAQFISATLLKSYDKTQVDSIYTANGIPAIVAPIKHDIEVYKLHYETTHPNGSKILASGAMILPVTATCAVPVCSYQHGTVTNKRNVPSYQSGELLLGIIVGTQGNIVCLPDYIGLGDSPGFHPYHDRESTAYSVLDLIRAAREYTDSINLLYNSQVFLWGYSQGGHATMAAHQMMEEDYPEEFNVVAVAPMSGAYDLSGAQTEVLLSDSIYSDPAYLPYLIMGLNERDGSLYNDLSEIFVEPYDSLLPIWFDGVTGIGTLNGRMPSVPKLAIDSAQLADFINNPNNPLKLSLIENDSYNWLPKAPVRLYYCEGDEKVGYQNSINVLNIWENQGLQNIEAISSGAANDHTACVRPSMISALQWFENHIRVAGPVVDFEVQEESNAGMSDGEIVAHIDYPDKYQYLWSNGATTSTISNLSAGKYSLTLSSGISCSKIYDKDLISLATSIQTPEESRSINIYPNPAKDNIILEIHNVGNKAQSVQIQDMKGTLVKEWKDIRFNKLMHFQTSDLRPGVYIVSLISENPSHQRLIIH